MTKFFNSIRKPNPDLSMGKKLLNTFFVFLFGLLLGVFSKFLDLSLDKLPYLFELLDLGNFFSRMAIWLLIAVILSIFSKTPIRAGINVFTFFTGMLISYYAYTKFFAGFFPVSYIMIWVILTFISPFLAFLCWYAKGNGIIALSISAIIIAILFLQAFSFDLTFTYFDIKHQGLEALIWLISIALLHKSPKQTAFMITLSFIFSLLINASLLF